jgi:O-antigen ligase
MSSGRQNSEWISRVRFILMCTYLVSQIYTIPLFAPGALWPIWPNLSDFVVVAMLLTLPCEFSVTRQMNRFQRATWWCFVFCFFACSASVLFAALLWQDSARVDASRGVLFGKYQLYRYLQFLVVFNVTCRIRMNNDRYSRLRGLSLAVFLCIAGGVLLTFWGIIPTEVAGAQLPQSLILAGPWAYYSLGTVDQGVGFVGFNHAYTAAQLILAAGLALHFQPRGLRSRALIFSLLLLCTLVSRSRAGFVCAVLMVFALEARRSVRSLILLIVISFTATGVVIIKSNLDDIVQRQSSTVSSYDEDGMSGRTDIWKERVDFITADPVRVLLGTGFGFAQASGENAHNLYLHLILETGLAGLGVFMLFQLRFLFFFLTKGRHGTALFWTIAVLLLSAVTQETLYPVLAFGHFIGFFALAIGLGSGTLGMDGLWTRKYVSLGQMQRPGLSAPAL